MLLACDIGNSNIVLGLYEGETLRASWRLTSRLNATVDEYAVMLGTLLGRELEIGTPVGQVAQPSVAASDEVAAASSQARKPAPLEPLSQARSPALLAGQITGAILSSVVPPLTGKLSEVIRKLTGADPLVVGPGVKTGLDVQYEDPREVGADRIVNAVGALTLAEPPLVIVDSGTATTFDVVLAPSVYLGGIIVPGLYISLDALVSRTAKLPKVELRAADKVVGRNTADSIRSGLYHGTGALVDGLIARIAAEQSIAPTVLATGGAAELLAGACTSIHRVVPDLTLIGLRELWRRNQA